MHLNTHHTRVCVNYSCVVCITYDDGDLLNPRVTSGLLSAKLKPIESYRSEMTQIFTACIFSN